MALTAFAAFLTSEVVLLLLLRSSAPYVRRNITPVIDRLVLRDLTFTQKLQRLRCKPLTALVDLSALMVSYEFYIISIPVLVWAGLPFAAVKLTLFMSVVNYLGQYIKDLFCAPRPLQYLRPGVQLDSHNTFWSREYGLPSVHTSNSLSFFGGLVIVLTDGKLLDWPSPGLHLSLAAAALSAFIALGRMYTYMHSLTDILCGALLAVSSLLVFSAGLGALKHWIAPEIPDSTWAIAPLQFLIAALCLLWFYPKPLRYTPSFGDAVVFLGAAGGVLTGYLRAPDLFEGPRFDAGDIDHWRVLVTQVVLGVIVGVAAKEMCRFVTQPLFSALLDAFPRSVRQLLQFPVHSEADLQWDALRNDIIHGSLASEGDAAAKTATPESAVDTPTSCNGRSPSAHTNEQSPPHLGAPDPTPPDAAPSADASSPTDGHEASNGGPTPAGHHYGTRSRARAQNSVCGDSPPAEQDADGPGAAPPNGLDRAGVAPPDARSDSLTAAEPLPVDAKGHHYDAVHLSRLVSYWVLGWTICELSPRMFQQLNLVRT